MFLFKKKNKNHKSISKQPKTESFQPVYKFDTQLPTEDTKFSSVINDQSGNPSSNGLTTHKKVNYIASDASSSSDGDIDYRDDNYNEETTQNSQYKKFSDNNADSVIKMPNTTRCTYSKDTLMAKDDNDYIFTWGENMKDQNNYPDVYIYNICKDTKSTQEAQNDVKIPRRDGDLEEIQCLKLTLKKCRNFSPQQLSDLANKIKNDTVNSKVISLHFINCPDLTNSDLSNLGASLGVGRRKIQYLSFDFYKCDRISEHGIMSFLCGLVRNLSSIRSLRLRMRGCREMTDPTSHSLVARLCVELPRLEELTVEFDSCGGITQQGVKELSQQIQAKDCIVRLEHCEFRYYKWWWAPETESQEIEAYIRRRLDRTSNKGLLLICGKVDCYVNRIISNNFECNVVPMWCSQEADRHTRKSHVKDLFAKDADSVRKTIPTNAPLQTSTLV